MTECLYQPNHIIHNKFVGLQCLSFVKDKMLTKCLTECLYKPNQIIHNKFVGLQCLSFVLDCSFLIKLKLAF